MKKSEIIKLKQVDHIMNEIKILTMIDHPFLVSFLFNARSALTVSPKTTDIFTSSSSWSMEENSSLILEVLENSESNRPSKSNVNEKVLFCPGLLYV